jgi:pilus assembly protein Flp/PilA
MRKLIIRNALHRFAHDERGATAIEYALIAGGISIAVLSGVTTLGETVISVFYEGLSSLF